MTPVELKHSSPSFIGCWDTDQAENCQKIIDYVKNERSLVQGNTGPLRKVNKALKESLDTTFFTNNIPSLFIPVLDSLQECLEDYLSTYPHANGVESFFMSDFNFQMYKPGMAYWNIHSERQCTLDGRRHLVWMIYLNDVDDYGGTYFKYQNVAVTPKAGRILIWPTDWTHSHMGIVSPTQEKCILTGWYFFETELYGNLEMFSKVNE